MFHMTKPTILNIYFYLIIYQVSFSVYVLITVSLAICLFDKDIGCFIVLHLLFGQK